MMVFLAEGGWWCFCFKYTKGCFPTKHCLCAEYALCFFTDDHIPPLRVKKMNLPCLRNGKTSPVHKLLSGIEKPENQAYMIKYNFTIGFNYIYHFNNHKSINRFFTYAMYPLPKV